MQLKSINSTVFFCLAAMACWAQSNTFPFPSSGNVGIGTTSPNSLLHLRGSTVPNPAGTPMFTIEAPHLAASVGSGGIIRFTNSVVVSDVATIKTHTEGPGNVSLRFQTGYGVNQLADRMIIDNIGNVGIGTTSPQAKLAVNGNILAKEVKVKTDISVPDYVFEPDYELASLAEVEAYVKEHKHLPEIPSAADIQRDGLDLAEMNLLLLKKVEELTLHLIEKDKSEHEMKNKISALEQSLHELKRMVN